MNSSFQLFKSILEDTTNSKVLYQFLKDVVKPPYDYSDLLRWQWAQSVSALDKLIHDLVRVGMVESFLGTRAPTPKFLSFGFTLDIHFQLNQNTASATLLFEQMITQKHGYLSFQEPDKIADALSNIWSEQHKWQKISIQLGFDENYTKTMLKNITIRRNQIVHEGDYSNILLQRQPILEEDVDTVIDFIKKLGEAIYNLVKL
ncbi:HEPN domain-containing protein [Paenibacillus sp. HB172176]|uniref:HEPN domain-containing protein n=1 Tax=Paenibacillus sp. HB172176 TaxID=2493690 RepID=UPI00143B3571|nr:HEPN domain-containing protein [Paenibacillus sp. HB172176]